MRNSSVPIVATLCATAAACMGYAATASATSATLRHQVGARGPGLWPETGASAAKEPHAQLCRRGHDRRRSRLAHLGPGTGIRHWQVQLAHLPALLRCQQQMGDNDGHIYPRAARAHQRWMAVRKARRPFHREGAAQHTTTARVCLEACGLASLGAAAPRTNASAGNASERGCGLISSRETFAPSLGPITRRS